MKILYLNGELAGRKIEIPETGAAIGRETDNDIQLLVGGVSRYHAKLEFRSGIWYLRDLGSTNGTKYNGDPIFQPAELHTGDVFAVGEQLFRVAGIEAPPVKTQQIPQPAQDVSMTEAAPKREEPAFVFRAPAPEEAPPSPQPQKEENTGLKITMPEPEEKPAEEEKAPENPLPVFGNWFSKKGDDADSANAETESETSRKRKTRSNILFYCLVLVVAVCCVALFWKMQQQDQSGQNHQQENAQVRTLNNPFFIFYEKQLINKNNTVFKFKLLLENKKLSIALDDFQSGRVYTKDFPDPVRDEVLEKLKTGILETKFMSSTQQERFSDAADNDRNFSRLVIGFEDKFNDIMVQDIILTSFREVEDLITSFLHDEYGLDSSMVESRDVLIREARQAFDLAEKQYNSYRTQPGNLWRAIENYRIAMSRYEVFAVKPPEWSAARQKLAEAEAALDTIRKEGHAQINMYYQQREFDKALQKCAYLLDYFPPGSKPYEGIRTTKINLEKIIKENR